MSWTKEHRWQEAALKLRKNLFASHQSDIERRLAEGQVGAWAHVESVCGICKLLTETRWCMEPIAALEPEPKMDPELDRMIHQEKL